VIIICCIRRKVRYIRSLFATLVGVTSTWRVSEPVFTGGPGELASPFDGILTEVTLEVLALAFRIAALWASVLGANLLILRVPG
jgi:hypothetical protein